MMVAESAILHRTLRRSYPTATTGKGVYLITQDGKRIFDGSCGAAVSSIGHGNQEVIDAICEQCRTLAFAHTSFFTSDPAEELAAFILDQSKDGQGAAAFAKVLWLTSGSESVESALKIARQYHLYNGQSQRVSIVGRQFSYHGNTLGALAAGNNDSRRAPFAPILGQTFHHVSRCFYDKDGAPVGLSEQEYEDKLIAEYEAMFQRLGPQTVAAVIVEPVGGATLGSVPPTVTYLPRLINLCRSHGILTIFDEVMCGMGRVGSLHAWQRLGGIAPDIQTIAKGLGAGYQPLSAVLLGRQIYSLFDTNAEESPFISGHTFQGHAMACTGALTVQRIVVRDQLIQNCNRMGDTLRETLDASLSEPFKMHGGSLRGLGLFQTVDFGRMSDIYNGPVAKEIAAKTFELGAAVYLCSSAVDAILFAPPFIATEEEIRELVGIFVKGVNAVLELRSN